LQGHTLAVVGKMETTLWDVKTGARLHVLAGGPPASISGAYAALAGCQKGTVYDTRTGRVVATRSYDNDCPKGAALSADGGLLLTFVSSNFFDGATEARLWALGGEGYTLLTGYDDAGAIGAFAPDGATIATAGPDGAVNLWDPVTRRKLLTLPGLKQKVTELRLSDDGRILTVAYEREVRIWPAASDNGSGQEAPAR
jgi:WD40 repeat protein